VSMMTKDKSKANLSGTGIFMVIIWSLLALPACQSRETGARNPDVPQKLLTHFSYSGKYLDISAETENARATHWKPDGTIIFVVGRDSDNVVAYHVKEPWQIHSGEFLHEVKVPGENQHGIYIREDGSMMWVFDRTSIWTYTLAIPWDITTRSEGDNFDLGDATIRGHDITFKPDGSMLFIDDRDAGVVYAYNLTTPWDVETGTLNYTLDISDRQIEVRGIEFLRNGTIMMLMDTERKDVMQYTLDEAWNIATATFSDAFDVSSQTHQGRGLSFNTDENIMYVTGRNEGKIFQYELHVK
jgi:hypothetical protein